MKTFREFILEVNLIEGRGRSQGQPVFASREDLEKHYGGIPSGMIPNNAASSGQGKWRLVSAEARKEQARRRKERLLGVSDQEHVDKAEQKAKKLRKAGLEAHHITPLRYSEKLKSSMSPEEWAERVKTDSAQGVYHGHHPKNIMGTVVKGTPEERRKRGIHHRKGGAHELEGKTQDLYSRGISNKDLISAAHRRKLRAEREKNQDNTQDNTETA